MSWACRVPSLVVGLLAGLTLSCAASVPRVETVPGAPLAGAPPTIADEAAAREEALALLAEELEAAIASYETGVEPLEAGEEIAPEARIAAAAAALGAGARDCAALPGCSLEHFLTAYERLLSWQELALEPQAPTIEDLEVAAPVEVEQEPGSERVEAVFPEVGRTVSLLRGTDLATVITLNGPVSAALEDWLTWMRPMFLEAWANYQFLRDEIAPIYAEADLPEALLFALIATETGGRVHSVSRAGAAGLLQFMPGTGRRYGLGIVDGFDQRYDPAASTRANVAYLNERFRELNDSLELALAAYNGGEGRVRQLHARLPGTSLWDPRFYYALPQETREYVPRVLAAAWLFLHPERYNLALPDLPRATTRLAVRVPTSIVELTICLGQEGHPHGWFRVLRNLNPQLGPEERIEPGREIVVPDTVAGVYERQCTEGSWVDVAQELHAASPPPKPATVAYLVRPGDTLARIASRHRCASVADIARLNNLRAPRYVIRAGQTLRIPVCS